MSEKSNLEEVANIVQNEGLDYAITGYMSHEEIEDVELSELWKQAGEILNKINNKLEPYYWD